MPVFAPYMRKRVSFSLIHSDKETHLSSERSVADALDVSSSHCDSMATKQLISFSQSERQNGGHVCNWQGIFDRGYARWAPHIVIRSDPSVADAAHIHTPFGAQVRVPSHSNRSLTHLLFFNLVIEYRSETPGLWSRRERRSRTKCRLCRRRECLLFLSRAECSATSLV